MRVIPLIRSVTALVAAGLVAATSFTSPAQAAKLTIANFGGANAQGQVVAFQKPFTQRHGVEVTTVEYTGDLAPIRAMVAKGRAEWDVAEVESTDLLAGCKEGLFEKVNRDSLANAGMLLPGSVQECGVGAFIWSTVLAYDGSRFKETPKDWRDFWDVTKFPGKRGLRRGARYNLEIALMADGVKRTDVYALLSSEPGLERALKKLQALKPHIVWWESGAQPPKMLASGEVAMSTAFNGRVAVANRSDSASRLQIAWVDAIYEFDYWVVIKGSVNQDPAKKYINFALSEEAQLAFSREIPYGPTNFNAIFKYDTGRVRNASAPAAVHQSLVDMSMAGSELPSAPVNMRKSLPFDAAFWLKRGPAIDKRYQDAMR